MADIRFKDLNEAAVLGDDYWIPSDSATDGVKKIKPANFGISTATQDALDLKANSGDLADVATSGDYNDLSNTPTLGTAAAADTTDFATAAQGSTADSAVQPGDLGDLATLDKVTSALLDPDVFSTAHSWSGVQTFTNPVVGTQSPGDNSTKAASTAFVTAAIVASGGGDLLSTNNLSDVADAGTAIRNLGGIDASSPVSITGATTLTGSAFGKLHVISGTSANYTVTLPTPVGNTGALLAFQVGLPASASKLYTLSTPSGVIGRQGSDFVIWASETVELRSDGTNWTVIGGRPVPFVGALYRSTNQTPTGTGYNVGLTSAGEDPSGLNLCFDSTNSRFVPARKTYWSFKGSFYFTQSGGGYIQGEIFDIGANAAIGPRLAATGTVTAGTWGGFGAKNTVGAGTSTAFGMRVYYDGTSPSIAGASVAARFYYEETPIW